LRQAQPYEQIRPIASRPSPACECARADDHHDDDRKGQQRKLACFLQKRQFGHGKASAISKKAPPIARESSEPNAGMGKRQPRFALLLHGIVVKRVQSWRTPPECDRSA